MKAPGNISTSHRTISGEITAPSLVPLPIIVCGSLLAFLGLLDGPTTVLFLPLHRRVAVAANTLHQHALHLTAYSRVDEQACLLSCCLPVVEYTAVGGHGRILYPHPHKEQRQQELEAQVERLEQSLRDSVTALLTQHPSVARVHGPVHFWLPEHLIWHKASLDGTGITCTPQSDQWAVPLLPSCTATDEGSAR